MKNYALFRLLHDRGMTTTKLAERIGSSHAHVSQVLGNKPGRGHFTRRKLAPHLTAAELELLQWDADGNLRLGISDGGLGKGPNVRTIADLRRKIST